MDRFAGREECVVTVYCIVKLEAGTWFVAHEKIYLQPIIEAGGTLVFDTRTEHGDMQVACLERLVRETDLVQHQDAGGFKPDQVIAVIDDVHAIGLCIADTYVGSCMDHDLEMLNKVTKHTQKIVVYINVKSRCSCNFIRNLAQLAKIEV